MAASGGLRVGVRADGFATAKAQLESMGRRVEPALRGALNTTASDARRQRYAKQMAPMFRNRSWINKRLVIKRVNARKGRFDARLIPSSAGVYVTEFKRWGYQVVAPTRARILVPSFRGHKVAAGFVNPASFARQPWSTRSNSRRTVRKRGGDFTYSYKKALGPAMGPSVAWFFKQLTSSTTIRWINKRLEQEFQRRVRRELTKRVSAPSDSSGD